MKRVVLILALFLFLNAQLFAQYEYKKSGKFSMKVNGKPVFVEYYKTIDDEYGSIGLRWKLENVSIAHFFFTGEVEVEVTVNASFTDYNLSPKRYGIQSTREGNTIKFKIDRPIKLNINMDNEESVNEQLFIFADALEDKPDLNSPDVVNILSYPNADNSGTVDVTSVIQNAINNLSAGQTLYFPPGQYLSKSIELKSNMTLYLEAGAVLLGTQDYNDYKQNSCFILLNDCENTTIRGYGRINFRGEQMQQDYGDRTWAEAIIMRGGSHNKLEDIFSVDAAVLNILLQSDNTTVYNVKTLANQNYPEGDNTDGYTARWGRNVVVDNCFVYGRDDNFAVKFEYENFVARNCILSTLESTQKIGSETTGQKIENIVYENNDAIHCGHAMTIRSRDGAEINNVWFRNIGVERIKPSPYHGEGMPFYFTVKPRSENANPSSITNVHIQNITCETRSQGVDGKSYISGNDADSKINNIDFTNLYIADTLVTDSNYTSYFTVKSYVDSLSFGTADYAIVEVKADNININEGGNGTFTIMRKGDLTPAFSVEYWIRGTAKNGKDYNTIGNSVDFASGQTTAVVNINTIVDNEKEGIEQVYISLKSDADKRFMLGPVFNAMINIRDAGVDDDIVISDPPFSGPLPKKHIEAEDMGLDNYEIEENGEAGGGEIIKLADSGVIGKAAYLFDRGKNYYNIDTRYLAEQEGKSLFTLYVNSDTVDSWVADTVDTASFKFLTHESVKVLLSYSDTIKIEGISNDGAFARLDYMDINVHEDTQPPLPDPMEFSIFPYGSGVSQITMSAKASDINGVEYYFENITAPDHSSGWQTDTLFSDSGLDENAQYTYRVKARDKSVNKNETTFSGQHSAFTFSDTKIDSTFLEQNGICVMEAENAMLSNNNDSLGWNGIIYYSMWYEESIEPGYVGRGYRTTKDGISQNAIWENGTQMAWQVNIANPGEYWIAIRRIAKKGADDSAFPGIDDVPRYTGDREFTGEAHTFKWIRGNKSLGTLTAGLYNVQIRRREDGMMIDRVMIANGENMLPSDGSAEEGPEESPRGDEVGVNEELENNSIPKSFKLNNAYPNPFNPSTTLSYALPQASNVSIIIYDIMGRKIKMLINEKQSAGNHRVVWNANTDAGNHVSSGVYLFRISADKHSGTGKLLYLR